MRFAHRVGLAAGAVAAVVVLAGCGTSNGTLLTTGAASQLTAELNQASTALDDYNCEVAYRALVEFKDDVNQLVGVNATLVKDLTDGAGTISTLANERCPTGISSDTTTSTTSTATTATGTTTTSTSVTTTSPATTTTTTSDTSTDSGGAAPTTETTPPVITTPPVTTATEPATTPDSGGAGLDSSGGNANGGSGVAGSNGQ